MSRPFRFAIVIAHAPSPTAFVVLARRAEELGYATLLLPDRTMTGLAPLTALAIAAEATTSLRMGSYVFVMITGILCCSPKKSLPWIFCLADALNLGWEQGSGHSTTSSWASPLRRERNELTAWKRRLPS